MEKKSPCPGCGGAGMACVCNPEKAVTWREIHVSVDDPDDASPLGRAALPLR